MGKKFGRASISFAMDRQLSVPSRSAYEPLTRRGAKVPLISLNVVVLSLEIEAKHATSPKTRSQNNKGTERLVLERPPREESLAASTCKLVNCSCPQQETTFY